MGISKCGNAELDGARSDIAADGLGVVDLNGHCLMSEFSTPLPFPTKLPHSLVATENMKKKREYELRMREGIIHPNCPLLLTFVILFTVFGLNRIISLR